MNIQTKKCSCCGIVKSIDEFYSNPSSKDGFQYICKDCIRIKKGQIKRIKITEYLPEFKKCPKCSRISAQSEFDLSNKNKDGLQSWCRECQNNAHRQNKLNTIYNITDYDYNILLEKQNGVCKICKQTSNGGNKFLSVDHNHKTGKIRGLLCKACNLMIGNAKDNPETLRVAAHYLEVENVSN